MSAPIENEESIGALVRRMQNNYIAGGTSISPYVSFNQYENINRIDAYLNSKHLSGATDSLEREKPFFNIVIAAVNIWFKATDIDRKDVRILPTASKDDLAAFLATVQLQKWMNESRFGAFLNAWGISLARYGSSVVKFVEKDGELIPSVVSWQRLVSDAIDFESNPKIEILELTESQLKQNQNYNQEQVDALLDARKEARTLTNGTTQDNNPDYVRLFEVHLNGSLAQLKMAQGVDEQDIPESDYNTFTQQMHVLAFTQATDKKGYKDFTLYCGKEKKDPYMITHLIKEDGRAQSIGAVEYLFDAQWMQNHTMKQMKDQLDLASKLVFQTADGNFVSQNALLDIENGDILTHEVGMPLEQVGNNSHDISSIQAFQQNWKQLGQEITNTPDALRGNTQPANTPYSSVALLSQNASSLFELMTENKGLHIEDMMREFVIPYLKRQLNNKDEIMIDLADYDIKKIDSRYIPSEAIRRHNKKFIKDLIAGKLPDEFNKQVAEGEVQSEMVAMGNMRAIDPEDISWKDVLDDLDWNVRVRVTNENGDTQTILTSLNTLLQTVVSKQGQPFTETEKIIVDQILSETGIISPIQFAQAQATDKEAALTAQAAQAQSAQQSQPSPMQAPEPTAPAT